jgi:hypothetical protein
LFGNTFAFVVVLITTVDMILRVMDVDAAWISVIRLLRVLRLLRLLEEIEGMRMMGSALGKSMSAVSGLIALLLASIVMFGIVRHPLAIASNYSTVLLPLMQRGIDYFITLTTCNQ